VELKRRYDPDNLFHRNQNIDSKKGDSWPPSTGGSPLGDERVAFSAATDVDREDWGLTWNVALETGGVLVGKKVRIELNVQAVSLPRP
jgi:hypothetical protein